jgi:hypothetical protein
MGFNDSLDGRVSSFVNERILADPSIDNAREVRRAALVSAGAENYGVAVAHYNSLADIADNNVTEDSRLADQFGLIHANYMLSFMNGENPDMPVEFGNYLIEPAGKLSKHAATYQADIALVNGDIDEAMAYFPTRQVFGNLNGKKEDFDAFAFSVADRIVAEMDESVVSDAQKYYDAAVARNIEEAKFYKTGLEQEVGVETTAFLFQYFRAQQSVSKL